ncbi:DUF6308 family protein [Rubrivivax sp. JA1024]|nr:DUF6308 family protein [Rubrivivax sp. JA1024]
MRDIFSLEPTTEILADDSYVVSYPYLLEYFSSKPSLEAGDVVRGAHMIYGWMPTILELYPEQGRSGLDAAAQTLAKARVGSELSDKEIEALASLVNNSLVGASKLLHFVAPNHFPIWDSKVYSFVHEKRSHHYRVNSIPTYRKYVALLKDLAAKPDFQKLHASVQNKLGYNVSPLRALELVMFLNAPVYGG